MATTVGLEIADEVATIRLERPPVNAIDATLCRDLIAALDRAEASAGVRGLLLTGRSGLFSAGLDLPTLLQHDRAEMAAFWRAFLTVFVRLWDCPLVVVAAIEGHAPAGGTVLALTADHRVAADGPYKIGLNEVAVGLVVPPFLCHVLVAMLGLRAAERILTVGALVAPAQALALGLVDEVVAQDAVIERARAALAQRLALPDAARRGTKRALRAPVTAAMAQGHEADLQRFLDTWFSPECQGPLRAVVAGLAARRPGPDAGRS